MFNFSITLIAVFQKMNDPALIQMSFHNQFYTKTLANFHEKHTK